MKTANKFGLSDRDLSTIQGVLQKHECVRKVLIFGSRTCSKYHAGSDIDLAIIEGSPTLLELARIQDDFEESTLPYFVDVLILSSIREDALKKSILKGRLIYDWTKLEVT